MTEENAHLSQMLDKREEYVENKELLLTVKKLNDELNRLRKSELQSTRLLTRRKVEDARAHPQGPAAPLVDNLRDDPG